MERLEDFLDQFDKKYNNKEEGKVKPQSDRKGAPACVFEALADGTIRIDCGHCRKLNAKNPYFILSIVFGTALHQWRPSFGNADVHFDNNHGGPVDNKAVESKRSYYYKVRQL